MTEEQVTFADDRGVWIVGSSGKPFGIEWSEIYTIGGYKLDCIDEVNTCLTFDFDYGEFVELNDTMSGFSDVVEVVTQHFPDLSQDWFERIRALGVDDDPLEVWKRAF